MKAIELFAGAGGAALGLEAAGFAHAALCEWDPDACATLRAAGLGPVVEGDVRDLDAVAAVAGERCDLLWSSFPCQAWSIAGSRHGAQDERNGWPWTVAALDRFASRWFLGENVPGLLQHRASCVHGANTLDLFGHESSAACAGCYFERVILRELRERFAFVGFWVLDAADYGVPQHRRRVFLWAGPLPVDKPISTHGPGRGLPWVSLSAALGIDFCVYGAGINGQGALRSHDRPAPTISGQGTATAIEAWRLAEPSLTVLARDAKGYSGGLSRGRSPCGASDGYYLATGARRLTVAQCARLQDFPADYPWQGTKTAHYRQIGNAVPPTLARVVGESVMRAEAKGTA